MWKERSSFMSWNYSDVLAVVFGIVGAVASGIAIWEFFGKTRSSRAFRWKHVSKAVRGIIADLNSRSFVPAVVVGLGRGGSIMGGLIAGNLGALRVCSMDRRRVASVLDSMSVPDFVIKPNVKDLATLGPSEGRLKLLLITGEVVTGFDLFHAKKTLESDLERSRIEYELLTASFTSMCHANFKPDIVFIPNLKRYRPPPWRMSESYINDRRADKTFHVSHKD
jgi:hypoxanthine phosphoribosyltransferase